MDLSIIVPTFNEAQSLPLLLWLLNKHVPPGTAYEVIVVDDGSPDGTADLADTFAQAWPHMHLQVLRRPRKLGLGSAYMHGLQQATGDFVFLLDADLSHHPKYIPQFLEKQRDTKCDVVTGTRYCQGGGVTGWGWARKLVSRGANLLASFLLGAAPSDLTGAFRLYKRSVLQRLLSSTTSKGYAFQMEVIVRAQYCGYRIQEVPIVFVDRLFGTSKLGPAEFILFLKGLLHLFFTL